MKTGPRFSLEQGITIALDYLQSFQHLGLPVEKTTAIAVRSVRNESAQVM